MSQRKNFIEELKWRGMLHEAMPGTEDLLNSEMVTGYIGFDPTADSLGIGNMVQIMTLLHFQNCGHKPMALIGGATGMVGDPSGKSEERNLLDEETLQHNLSCQKKQLEKFLNFNCGENSAEIVNNYDWFKTISFLDFLREVGKYITVNYMKAKDSVKSRIEGDEHGGKEGMSFTEFSYQLVQGYDFYWLWKNKGVKLQMGGSDQFGNITTGTELIRRKDDGKAWALVTPLIKKADGTKFGKTESGNIWLDAKRTSPYSFYQFWLNASDSDVKTYIRIFSLKTKEEIEALETEETANPGQRVLQKALAEEVTVRVHSQADFETARTITELLFKSKKEEIKELPAKDLEFIYSGLTDLRFEINKSEIASGVGVLDLLAVKTKIFKSNGEARKMIQAGAVSINKEKVTSDKFSFGSEQLLNDSFFIAQKGKKDYFIVKVV
ncbi:MAG: tyrosine--tRNA ligase [Bacteroidia bacterium]|nr:tyrosine--tRNA ligase [Bacteroidia bacterium]